MRRAYRLYLIAKVIWIFVLLDCGFKLVGFDRTRSALVRRAKRTRVLPAEHKMVSSLDEIIAAVSRGTRFYYRKRLDCLPRALTTYYLARKASIPVEICLGVKKYPFAGHCWVEYDGNIIADTPSRVRMYTILARE
jgi:hypothetical protein